MRVNYSRTVRSHSQLDGSYLLKHDLNTSYSSNYDRFVGVGLLNLIDPALLLSIYGVLCAAFSLGVVFGPGTAGIGCLFTLFFFESICYPVIFTLATANLGKHTKRGSGLVVMVCIFLLCF